MSKRDEAAQSQACYQQLRRLLIHMHVRPGLRMVMDEWANRLKVHRTALREAMSLLAHEGLLRRGERGGFFVPSYDQRDLDEIFAARAIIEAGAIRLLGEMPEGELDLSQLNAAVAAMERLYEEGYEMGFLEADRRFHSTLVHLTGNRRLIELYERAPLPLFPSPLADPEARRRVRFEALQEQKEIARLLSERHIPEAIDLLHKHLYQVHQPTPVY